MKIILNLIQHLIGKGNGTPTEKSTSQVTNMQLFKEAAESTIQRLAPSKAKSTIDNYRTALRSFLAFAGPGITLGDIDEILIGSYHRWLQERGVSLNTSSCYMRSLRALLHAINPEGGWSNIFKDIFTGNAKTNKRAITKEDVCRLLMLTLPKGSRLQLYRDMFVFCFYALGMPFVDLAFLRRSQIKNGYIVYSRRKTGQPIRVKIEKPMQDIINRYARKGSRYVFPILTQEDAQLAMREYETALRRYNYTLKRLEKMAGIPHITSYVARHSWASMANESGTPMPIISKGLGHTDMKTTIIYLREMEEQRIDEYNATAIREIHKMMVQMKGKGQKIRAKGKILC